MKTLVAGSMLVLVAALPERAAAQETMVRFERDLITRQEIQQRVPDLLTAFDVVQRLRPHFLREKSVGAIAVPTQADGTRNQAAVKVPIQTYVNGARAGLPAVTLREIQATAVIDILYLNASDATTRFGTGHDNGAIVVRTGS
jgi:hypothetical protein